jgi:hypothetical protein
LFLSLEEHQPIDLFGAEPLGILPQPAAGQAAAQAVQTEDTALRTWRRCAERSVLHENAAICFETKIAVVRIQILVLGDQFMGIICIGAGSGT